MKKLILIDGNAIIHRSYHALPPLSTKSGELVNAVYGFASTLLSVIDQFKPDYIACSFDLASPTFRHEQFKDYKANRIKADDDLYAQIPRVKEVVKTFNIPIYEKEGFEADDVIGTISCLAGKEEVETIIVTGDMDTLQLVNEKTRVYSMSRGLSNAAIYDTEKVFFRYGIKPEQLIDFKGLRGDPSDNIPGVKGIGEKTATDLLQKYQTLEGVYKNINEIKGAVKEKLVRDKSQAILSKQLATIDVNVPIIFEKEKAVLNEFDREAVKKLFSELNFFSLIKRLPKDNDSLQNSTTLSGVKDFKFEIVSTEKLDEFILESKKQAEIAFFLEIKNENILGVAFSWKIGRAFFIANENDNFQKLNAIFSAENILKIGFDLKTSYKILKKNGVILKLENSQQKSCCFDILLGAYVLDPGKKIEFNQLVFENLGEEISSEKIGKKQLSMLEEIPNQKDLANKSCQQADYILKLKKVLEKNIEEISNKQNSKNNLASVFEKIEMPLIEVLAEMELNGVELNTVLFNGISEKITTKIKKLEKNIYTLAGTEFNINSPKQLSDILFEELNLSTFNIKKGKTGYSTASSELEKLRDKHKIIEKIEQYRELFKLKTTYLDTLPLLVDNDSRLHSTFNQAVTATGRLSSTEPNLQNIPIKTELGQLMRSAFIAKEGFKLISADYSQIDLRCVAHVSNDKKMIEAFNRGDDIHKITASEINKVSLSQVTEKMRSSAKALNFGTIYGMSSFGFSQSAGISREEAQKFINTYMENFSSIASYMKETKKFARKNGYVETLLGRRRNLPEINAANFQVVSSAERMAINMPIQGLAADIMKIAMINVYNFFKNDKDVRIILQIHDEIILEVKKENATEIAKKIKELLENAYPLSVPLVAEVEIGDSWGEI